MRAGFVVARSIIRFGLSFIMGVCDAFGRFTSSYED